MTELLYSLDEINIAQDWRQKGTWLSIGTFDGVHLGHQALIHRLVEGAHCEQRPAVLITFYPHPIEVIRKQVSVGYLTSIDERAQILRGLGVDAVITLRFTPELAVLEPKTFMQVIKNRLNFTELLVGFNFALGKDRKGDSEALEAIGNDLGYHLQVIAPVRDEEIVFSSSQIRAYLASGEVEKAAKSLGRWYEVSGKVIHGDARGHLLGFATANLEVWPEKALPQRGVYACWASFDGEHWPAVVNIGVRPTFEKGIVLPRIEAHLLDFSGDLYGSALKLEFVAHLRGEKRFESIDALKQQVDQDKETARNLLHSIQSPLIAT